MLEFGARPQPRIAYGQRPPSPRNEDQQADDRRHGQRVIGADVQPPERYYHSRAGDYRVPPPKRPVNLLEEHRL
jgi:hypothetical protein